jgi:alkylation response protein AidB-like acyl-CoA dehydrogenase
MSTAPPLPTTAPDNEEEAAVRETAREIAARCADATDHLECWKRLDEAGFLELRASEDGHTPLADTTMTALVVQELAATVCGAPLVGALLASELVRLAGGDGLEEPATVLLGEDLADLADLAGPAGGIAWDAAAPVGRALAIDGDELVAVPLADRTPSQDLSRPTARPAGDPEPLGLRLDGEGRSRFESFARLLLTADLLGAAGGALADTVRYAGERVQFGVPIGSFQAVQHLCARAYGEVEAIRSALLYGAWALDAGRDHREAALVAKAYAGRAGVRIVEAAVQVHGGVAITWEFPVHRHLRRVLLDDLVLGDPDASAEALLRTIETSPATGDEES